MDADKEATNSATNSTLVDALSFQRITSFEVLNERNHTFCVQSYMKGITFSDVLDDAPDDSMMRLCKHVWMGAET